MSSRHRLIESATPSPCTSLQSVSPTSYNPRAPRRRHSVSNHLTFVPTPTSLNAQTGTPCTPPSLPPRAARPFRTHRYVRQVTISGFKTYKDTIDVEPFSPHHNVVGTSTHPRRNVAPPTPFPRPPSLPPPSNKSPDSSSPLRPPSHSRPQRVGQVELLQRCVPADDPNSRRPPPKKAPRMQSHAMHFFRMCLDALSSRSSPFPLPLLPFSFTAICFALSDTYNNLGQHERQQLLHVSRPTRAMRLRARPPPLCSQSASPLYCLLPVLYCVCTLAVRRLPWTCACMCAVA